MQPVYIVLLSKAVFHNKGEKTSINLNTNVFGQTLTAISMLKQMVSIIFPIPLHAKLT